MLGLSLTREKRNVLILVFIQAFAGAQMPMVFTISGLAGQSLASNLCWATLPISLVVFGSMTTAPWLSLVMQRFGRRTGFYLGCLGGLMGGGLGAYALSITSFPLFLVSSYFTGIYMCTNGFLRFAAADTASKSFRPKAVSYVLAGGLIAAIIGPQLVKATFDIGETRFFGTFMAIMGLNLIGSIFITFLDIPVPAKKTATSPQTRAYWELLRTPAILVPIVCASVSYSLMNLVMTSTPLAVVGTGHHYHHAADIVSMHVLAMFMPSFFTGHIIAKFGAQRVVSVGLIILTCSGVAGLSGVDLHNFYIALILLGLGWNFGFIGATTMLLEAHQENEKGKVQGLNDFIVFGSVTIASLASGTLMNCTGGTAIQGWYSVNWAMVPFLALAAGALTWLTFHDKNRKAKGIDIGT